MTTALMNSTQITYQFNLTVNVNVNADKAFLLVFACFAFIIWKIRLFFYRVSLLMHDFVEAVNFVATIGVIGFKAAVYGVAGVRL
jgi:hypothetical protein